jgi:peptidoglycan L-alanyl-D-glutamate endopeptidase CwlK
MLYLGTNSLKQLVGVHPRLVEAVKLAIKYSKQDFGIIAGGGLRTRTQAEANAKAGTGITNSMHLKQPDGFGHAVDLVAYENGSFTWGKSGSVADRDRLYLPIREAMLKACDDLNLLIQHGADWDQDGILGEAGEWDWPHFQIPNAAIPGREGMARVAATKRKTERAS